MTTSATTIKPQRLGFIDLARAIAILLMLEGHFVDVTLADEWRDSGSFIYATWNHLRGLAAPMFFTVTGIIFAYLLKGAGEPGFWKSHRVRRGLRRSGELFFWGYFIQLDVSMIPWVLEHGPTTRMSAFHVLQCIATGLLVILALHGLARVLSRRMLVAVHALGGFGLFVAGIFLVNHHGYLPPNASKFLQNPILGPVGPFPLAPWLGFTLYGAAIGIALRGIKSVGPRLAAAFMGVGGLLAFAGWGMDHTLGSLLLDLSGRDAAERTLPTMFHGRFGQILLVLGVLMWIEHQVATTPEWLRTIGRNTFPIYVGHVIILNGGIFGFGLNDLLRDSLTPWQAAIGALAFCGCFALAVQWTGPMALRWRDWRLAGSTS